MARKVEVSVRIFGGLPVDVELTMQPAEPDVGIFSDYIDDWEIVGINGQLKKCDWVQKKLDNDAKALEAFLDECYEALS